MMMMMMMMMIIIIIIIIIVIIIVIIIIIIIIFIMVSRPACEARREKLQAIREQDQARPGAETAALMAGLPA